MRVFFRGVIAIAALGALSACQSTTSGPSGLASQFASLQGKVPSASLTPDGDVAARSGSATYNGVANVTTGSGTLAKGYLGSMNMKVNFDTNSLSGDANNFFEYFSLIASPTTGNSVSGDLSLNGSLTGANTASIGSGIIGTAGGIIDGTVVNMTMSGNLTGLTADSMVLYFNGTGSGGVAYGVE